MRIFATVTLSLLISTASVAGPFDGEWDLEKAYCAEGGLSETRQRISGNVSYRYVVKSYAHSRDKKHSSLWP